MRFNLREWRDRARDMERERDAAEARVVSLTEALERINDLPLDADITDAHNISAPALADVGEGTPETCPNEPLGCVGGVIYKDKGNHAVCSWPAHTDPTPPRGVPHNHRERVEGCFRCDLSDDEMAHTDPTPPTCPTCNAAERTTYLPCPNRWHTDPTGIPENPVDWTRKTWSSDKPSTLSDPPPDPTGTEP
jgi:hypothetical protein